MNLTCFSLSLFGLPFLFSWNFARGVLLDNPSWMRVDEVSGGLNIEDGDPPTRKKKVSKSVTASLAIKIMYGEISNKPVN